MGGHGKPYHKRLYNQARQLSSRRLTREEKKGTASFADPRYAVRPSAIKRMRSNIAKTSEEGWWIVQMIVFPLEAKFLKTCKDSVRGFVEFSIQSNDYLHNILRHVRIEAGSRFIAEHERWIG